MVKAFGGSIRDGAIHQLEQKCFNILTTGTIILVHSSCMAALKKHVRHM